MGRYAFSSWTLHMASITLREWAQASRHTRALVWTGIATLIGSTVVIGLGNYFAHA